MISMYFYCGNSGCRSPVFSVFGTTYRHYWADSDLRILVFSMFSIFSDSRIARGLLYHLSDIAYNCGAVVPGRTVQWIVVYLVGTTARADCGVRGHSSTTVVPTLLIANSIALLGKYTL